MKRAGLAAVFCAMATTGVSAQEVYVDAYEDAEAIDEPAVVEEHIVRERVIERSVPVDDDGVADDSVAFAPRVYGWSYEMRPEDCGTFKYWNGAYCADARYEPPEND